MHSVPCMHVKYSASVVCMPTEAESDFFPLFFDDAVKRKPQHSRKETCFNIPHPSCFHFI